MSQKQKKIVIGVFGGCVILLLLVLVLMNYLGNTAVEKKARREQPQATPPKVTESAKTTPDPHAGKVKSEMTGEWIKKKNQNNRYVAVMINNIEYAFLRQEGTSKADIIYEALAEGGITRMMALYQNVKNVKSIGSVRSARHYYVQFAREWDAIFCHFGHTKYATAKMEKLKTENLSGLSAIGPVVYARTSRYAAPHNVYTDGKRIRKGAKKMGYALKVKDRDTAEHFTFYDEDTDLQSGKRARRITLPFSYYSICKLRYNKKKKQYLKYEYNRKHMDVYYKKQLSFKNVLVQFVDESNIDRNGYQTMKLSNNTGKGYYITNGKKCNITWERNEAKNTMVYRGEDGSTLKINPGRTYIAVYPKNRRKLIQIK